MGFLMTDPLPDPLPDTPVSVNVGGLPGVGVIAEPVVDDAATASPTFGEDRARWLHKLTATQIKALFDFRRAAREAQPDAVNAMAAAWNEAPATVRVMPRAFVVSLDRPA